LCLSSVKDSQLSELFTIRRKRHQEVDVYTQQILALSSSVDTNAQLCVLSNKDYRSRLAERRDADERAPG
jgi:hypothetical protein